MRAIRRLLLCVLPLACAACGPTGIGAGIYSLFGGDDVAIDFANKPDVTVSVDQKHQTAKGIFSGPQLQTDESEPYIRFVITVSNRDRAKLTVLVKLAGERDFSKQDFEELETFLDADTSDHADDESSLIYVPNVKDLQTKGAAPSGFDEQLYRIKFRIIDAETRRRTKETLEWTLDKSSPEAPTVVEVDRGDPDATKGTVLRVRWSVQVPAGVDPGDEIARYEIIYEESSDSFGKQQLADAAPEPGKATTVGFAMSKLTPVNTTEIDTVTPTQRQICGEIVIGVIAIDYAENRSKFVASDGSPFLDGILLANFEALKCDTTRMIAEASTVSQGGAGERVPQVFFDDDDCPDEITFNEIEQRITVRFGICEDGRQTGFEEPVQVPVGQLSIGDIISLRSFSLGDGSAGTGVPGTMVAIGSNRLIGLVAPIFDAGTPVGLQVLGTAVGLPPDVPPDYAPREAVEVIDLNLDGYNDIVIRAEHETLEDYLVAYLGTGELGRGSVNLTEYTPVTTATGVRAVQTLSGDFNGDTFPDIALCDGAIVRLLLGDGTLDSPHLATGTYAVKRIVVPAGGPKFLSKGDINNDGIEDIFTSNDDGTFSVIRGTTDNNFDVPDTFSAVTGARIAQSASPGAGPLIVVDFSGDSILDVVIASVLPNTVSVLFGGGANGVWDKTFTPLTTPTDFDPASLEAGDLNGNGRLDITVYDATGALSQQLFGNGSVPRPLGTFTVGPALSLPLHTADQLALVDLNGDSILDIVAAGDRTGAGIQTLFLGNGTDGAADGTFGDGLTRGLGDGSVLSLVTADFNRDAIPDLAAASSTGVDVQFGGFSQEDQRFLFASDRLYKFRPAAADPADRIAQTIVGDFNSDGIMDLISRTDDAINVQLGKNVDGRTDGSFLFEYSTPADFLGSEESLECGGISNFTDLLNTLGTGLRNELTDVVDPGRMGAADFDGDGGLDVVVVDEETRQLAVLRNYGRDCGDGAGLDLAGFGMFEAPKLYPVGGTLPFIPGSMVVKDLNDDGIPDVAALAKDPGPSGETFCVMLGERDPLPPPLPPSPLPTPSLDRFRFGAAMRAGTGGDPKAIDCADLNQDGNLDIVVADKTAASITIFFGDGSGNYENVTTVTVSVGVAAPRSIAIGDLNGDLVLDIVVGGDAGVQIIYGDAGAP